ncbi:MAG: hypothetical protein P8J64_07245 [Dehalococcoidia bacterium]|nr:hypothetical protein [Dehalococcoidia bacterium]
MAKEIFLIVPAEPHEIDLTNEIVKNQFQFIDEAIEQAVLGIHTTIATRERIVATYALPNAVTKRIRCRVIPDDQSSIFRIHFTPQKSE